MKKLPLFQIAATGLFWAWCFIWMSNAGNAGWPIRSEALFAPVRLSFWFGNCIALALFVYALGRRRGASNRPALVACGVLQALGSLVTLALPGDAGPFSIVFAAVAFVTGFATAGFLPGWRKAVSSIPSSRISMFVGSSAALGIAVFMADLLLAPVAAKALFVALPLASCASALADPDPDARVFDPVRPDAHLVDSVRGAKRLKWVYMAVTFAVLFVMGLDTLSYGPQASPNGAWPALGVVLSLAFFAVFLLGYRNAEVARYLVTPYMPLAVATAMLVPFMQSDASTLLQALITLDFACWCFMLAEGLGMALQSSRSHVAQNVALGLCPVAAYALQAVLGFSHEPSAELLTLTYVIVATTALLVMFHTTFFVQRRADGETSLRAAARILAEEHALSQRETEVLEFLALGHGQPYIAEQLCLAPGTIKTHVLHIYQKLGVHGREELLEAVRSSRKEMLV